jgi:hypothetical protein
MRGPQLLVPERPWPPGRVVCLSAEPGPDRRAHERKEGYLEVHGWRRPRVQLQLLILCCCIDNLEVKGHVEEFSATLSSTDIV